VAGLNLIVPSQPFNRAPVPAQAENDTRLVDLWLARATRLDPQP